MVHLNIIQHRHQSSNKQLCESFCLNHQYLEKISQNNIFRMPSKIYHRVMYIAPSSGHICETLIWSLIDSKEVWGCFRIHVWIENAALFLKDLWKFIKIYILWYGFNESEKNYDNGILKLPGRDGSWMGDYATCSHCHLVHAARFAHAPHLLQCYDRLESITN